MAADLKYCGMLEAFDEAASPKGLNSKARIHLRNATTADIPEVCSISGSATKKFGTIPELKDLADDQEEPVQIQKWLAQGRVYLAESSGKAIGFIAAYPVDDAVYIAEVSVDETYQGKGVGAKLVDAVKQWALVRRMHDGMSKARVSLTTYADVSWNGVWYRKLGFAEVGPADVGPWHVEILADDKAKLERPRFRRCCMLWESDTPPV